MDFCKSEIETQSNQGPDEVLFLIQYFMKQSISTLRYTLYFIINPWELKLDITQQLLKNMQCNAFID